MGMVAIDGIVRSMERFTGAIHERVRKTDPDRDGPGVAADRRAALREENVGDPREIGDADEVGAAGLGHRPNMFDKC